MPHVRESPSCFLTVRCNAWSSTVSEESLLGPSSCSGLSHVVQLPLGKSEPSQGHRGIQTQGQERLCMCWNPQPTQIYVDGRRVCDLDQTCSDEIGCSCRTIPVAEAAVLRQGACRMAGDGKRSRPYIWRRRCSACVPVPEGSIPWGTGHGAIGQHIIDVDPNLDACLMPYTISA